MASAIPTSNLRPRQATDLKASAADRFQRASAIRGGHTFRPEIETGVEKSIGGGMQAAMGGAATGAAIGSAIPVVGTGVGAIVGGIFGVGSYIFS